MIYVLKYTYLLNELNFKRKKIIAKETLRMQPNNKVLKR